MLHPGFYVPPVSIFLLFLKQNLVLVPFMYVPNVWNSLENTIRDSQTFSTFKQHLKTHLF